MYKYNHNNHLREEDPVNKEWSTMLVTVVGSWGNLVPRGQFYATAQSELIPALKP
jgi:hypothetical protein